MKKQLTKMLVDLLLLQKIFHNLKTPKIIKFKKTQTKNKRNLLQTFKWLTQWRMSLMKAFSKKFAIEIYKIKILMKMHWVILISKIINLGYKNNSHYHQGILRILNLNIISGFYVIFNLATASRNRSKKL